MRNVLLLTGLLVAGIVSMLTFFLARDSELADLQVKQEAPTETQLEPADLNGIQLEGSSTATREVAPVFTPNSTPVAPSAGATCTVIGQIVDGNQEPLEGVTVQLAGYKEWAEGLDLPRLTGRFDFRGFETATDGEGQFRFETPLPTVERTKLSVLPDPFHDSTSMWFGGTRANNQTPLTAGLRDLGIITLESSGSISGRVVDEYGSPVADVKIGIGPGPSYTYSRDTWTDANGSYLVGHAPQGTYGVSTKIEGFLNQFQEPVSVALNQETKGIDFVLVASPTIEGMVVNEQGFPLEGVRLSGWPVGSGGGSAASARTGADGRFVMSLPQVAPLTLSAKLDGYQTWGDQNDQDVSYQPGTRDLHIELKSQPPVRFLVVDDETSQPLTSYGLNILENNGSQYAGSLFTERRRPQSKDHPEGLAEVTGREGVDLYVIASEGYLMATGDVKLDPSGSGLQTVRLRKGLRLTGRVLHDGSPAAGIKVEIESGFMRSDALRQSLIDMGMDTAQIPSGWQVNHGSQQFATTDAAGRFEFLELTTGMFRIGATAGSLGVIPHQVVELNAEGLDMGDLVLSPGVTLSGSVLLPANIEPEGLEVYLDGSRRGKATHVNGAGEFEFTAVAAGVHTLSVGERPGKLAATEPLEIVVEASPIDNITLDARDRAMCEVSLRVEFGDQPAKDGIVILVGIGDSREREQLGVCDDLGRVHGYARAWGEAAIQVWVPSRTTHQHPEVRLQLAPGGHVDQTVSFDFASLAITLPNELDFPELGCALLKLTSTNPNVKDVEHRLTIKEGALVGHATKMGTMQANTLTIGQLLAAEYKLTFELREGMPADDAPTNPGTPITFYEIEDEFLADLPPYFTHTQAVFLESGEVLELKLP